MPLTRLLEVALRRREQQYRALADLGTLAMAEPNLDVTLNAAASRLRDAMHCDFTKVLDHRSGAPLLVRGGSGWPAGIVGGEDVPAGVDSPAQHSLARDAPVIVTDMVTETRFTPARPLLDLGIRSAICVVIAGTQGSYGVLEADSREPGRFQESDIAVLQAYANVLSGAVAQHERERASSQFASIVSHEMRTPLTSLIGFSRRLLRRLDQHGSIGPDRRDELELIHRESYRLHRTIDLLIALGEVERRGTLLELEELPVSELLEHAIAQVEERYPRTKFALTTPPPEVVVHTDEVAFGRIVANLLENAAKYSPDDSTILVDVTADAAGPAITVSDACAGLDDGDLRRVFQPSFRGSNSHKAGSGLGVGLYVAQRLAERLGGNITVENRPPVGCAFTLRFDRDRQPTEGS